MKRFAKALLNTLPRGIQRRLRDRLEDLRRRRPAAHCGLDEYGLSAAQVYPRGTNFDECLRAGIASQLSGLVIRKATPVASVGSCFADEFASHMRKLGFNYVTAESDVFPASANWGRVYTIPALQQIVRYSTASDFAMPIERSRDGWFDPLRESAIGTLSDVRAGRGGDPRASRRLATGVRRGARPHHHPRTERSVGRPRLRPRLGAASSE